MERPGRIDAHVPDDALWIDDKRGPGRKSALEQHAVITGNFFLEVRCQRQLRNAQLTSPCAMGKFGIAGDANDLESQRFKLRKPPIKLHDFRWADVGKIPRVKKPDRPASPKISKADGAECPLCIGANREIRRRRQKLNHDDKSSRCRLTGLFFWFLRSAFGRRSSLVQRSPRCFWTSVQRADLRGSPHQRKAVSAPPDFLPPGPKSDGVTGQNPPCFQEAGPVHPPSPQSPRRESNRPGAACRRAGWTP